MSPGRIVKILHIDTGRELRGGQLQALLLIAGLRDAGHECVLSAREDSPIWRAARDANVVTVPVSLMDIRRRSKDVDVVHAHDAHSHSLAAIAARRPLVVSRRVMFPVKDRFCPGGSTVVLGASLQFRKLSPVNSNAPAFHARKSMSFTTEWPA